MKTQDTDRSQDTRLQLRQAFGKFPTGVTVVTSRTPQGQPIGFTANSYTSVSLDPPLLLVCLAKTSSNLAHFEQAGSFAVNILSDQQRDVSNRFASKVADRFAETDWREGSRQTPILNDTSAWFDCTTDNVVDAGDHIILIGQIQDFGMSDENPLAYLNGHYLDLNLGETVANAVATQGGIRVGAVLEHAGQLLLRRDGTGWTLPFGTSAPSLREARGGLSGVLTELEIGANIGRLYSVFDSPKGDETWLVFLGDIETPSDHADLQLFDVQDLPLDAIETKFFRSILGRFQTEVEGSRFGVYVDDAHQSGAIHGADRNVTPWTRFIATQETRA